MANEYINNQLCFGETVADITEGRYGVLHVTSQLHRFPPDLEADCQHFVTPEYLYDIMDSCNGKHFCKNLKALPSSIYCDDKKTYTDYVLIFYRCIEGGYFLCETDYYNAWLSLVG